MRKLFLAILIAGISGSYVFADIGSIWISSNTATADTTQNLCKPKQGNTTARGLFHGARINTGGAGTLTVYASSASATSPIAAINTAAVASLDYDVIVSSGLTYSQTGTANITLLYQCY